MAGKADIVNGIVDRPDGAAAQDEADDAYAALTAAELAGEDADEA